MKYRVADERDLSQLARMRWEFQIEDETEKSVVSESEFSEKCVEYLRQNLKAGDWTFWIAEQNSEIVSHIFVKIIISVPRPARIENKWGYLTNVYTKPKFRGRGIGARLLRQVKLWATKLNFEILIVSPSADSTSFYKREGFAAETDFYQLRLREF